MMKIEVWRKCDLIPDVSSSRGRCYRCYPGTLKEFYNGKMTVELDNGGGFKKVLPEFGRRAPQPSPSSSSGNDSLPAFIKMGSNLEVSTQDPQGNTAYFLAKVLSFVGKEELVVEYLMDGSKMIVYRSQCRIPNPNNNLSHYKEIDKLKKYKVEQENPIYSMTQSSSETTSITSETQQLNVPNKELQLMTPPESRENTPAPPIRSDKEGEEILSRPPSVLPTPEPPMEQVVTINENEEEEELIKLKEEESPPEIDRMELLERMMMDFKTKFESMTQDYRELEKRMAEIASLNKPSPPPIPNNIRNNCMLCPLNECNCHESTNESAMKLGVKMTPGRREIVDSNGEFVRWPSRNSVEDERPNSIFSNDGDVRSYTNGVTPPPGFSNGNGNGFPAFMGPPLIPPFPYAARRQLGNKIFMVLATKLGEDEASKMTDAVLSSLL